MSTDVWTFTEEAPEYVEAVADLWHWSTNYGPEANPFQCFLDDIGWSDEHLGEPLMRGDRSQVLGYLELGKLAKALTEYADRPADVTRWIDELMEHEGS